MNDLHILITKPQDDYELIDSGDSEKLERFGSVTLRRPDPQALWSKFLPNETWEKADAHFTVRWNERNSVPKSWNIMLDGKTFALSCGSFKHVGVFPEQLENWAWIEDCLKTGTSKTMGTPKVLNLFGYTGGATLAALKGGADVTHVDGSKVAIGMAKENSVLSGLADRPQRYMLDDALEFVKREIRRGTTYDGIILDPPAFGRGAKGEVWKIETSLPELFALIPNILSPEPLFVLLNGYASGYSSLAYRNCLQTFVDAGFLKGGDLQSGEVTLEENKSGRLLPAGIYARWKT